MNSCSSPERGPRGGELGRWPFAVAVATGLLHTVIALWIPLPSYFRKYALAAEHYLSGQLPAERVMDFSPFYLWLSVWVERWFPHPEAAVHWLQIALVAASAGLLFGLLRSRFSLRLSLLGVAFFAIDRHVLVYERILEPEAAQLFFLLGFLFFTTRGRPWLGGLFAALSVSARPAFLPVFLLTPLYFKLHESTVPPLDKEEADEEAGDVEAADEASEGSRKKRVQRPRRWWLSSLAVLLPVAMMMGLLMLRAQGATGDPRTPMMNPGTVFFEGNNPMSHGTSAIYPPMVLELVRHGGEIPDSAHHYYRAVARADAGRELPIAEVNAYWGQRAMAHLRAEPGRALELVRAKLVRAFHGFRWHDIPTAWSYESRLRLPTVLFATVSFALVSSLALLGLLFEVRRWRVSLLLYAAGLVQLGVMLTFYVSARQRLVLVPIALYFAAAALERMLELRWRGAVLGGLAVLMAVVLTFPEDLMRDEAYRRRGYLETERLLHELREKTTSTESHSAEPIAHHADLAVEAIASAPWWLDWLRPAYFPRDRGSLESRLADRLAERPLDLFSDSADFDRAAVLLEAGRLAEAEPLLAKLADRGVTVYRGGRQSSEPLALLGRSLALRGQTEKALGVLEQALERVPGDPFVLADLIALSEAGGDAEAGYRQQLETHWSRLGGELLLGRAYLRFGRPQDAEKSLRWVAERLPEYREARVLRAAALGDSGRIEEGVAEYLEASRIRLEPLLEGERIVRLFRRWVAENPDRPEVPFYAAQVFHQHGYFREALDLLEGAELPPPLVEPAEREKARIVEAFRKPSGRSPLR